MKRIYSTIPKARSFNKVKKHALLVCILAVTSIYLYAGSSADAIALSGSYSTRAYGTQANYWNPANLALSQKFNNEVMLFNTSVSIGNNALSIRKYNEMNGKYLTDYDKEKFVQPLNGELVLKAGASHSMGAAIEDYAITGGLNFHAKGKMSADYLRLILYGNEYDKLYVFDKDNNGFDLLTYADLTYGKSVYAFDLFGKTIYSGVAVSLLTGFFVLETRKYDNKLKVSDDGVLYNQLIEVIKGTSGVGLKSLVGFRNDYNEDLSFSLAVDNAFGFITWSGNNESMYYKADVENIDFSSLDQVIVQTADSTSSKSSFTTILYPTLNFGTEYKSNGISLSCDWKQGFVHSVLTSKTPDIGIGIEIQKIPFLPLRVGYKPGIGSTPFSVSYGFALLVNKFSYSFGVESVRAIIPSSYSEGISISMTSKWSF